MKVFIDELEKFQRAVLNGEDLAPEAIESVLSAARRLVPSSELDDVRALKVAVDTLEQLVRERLEEVGEELRRLSQGRQAIRGYNHLRGHDGGQRLYRRA